MGSVLSHAPDQDDFKRACVQGDFDKAIQALRHNRKLVDVRVCRNNGDKVLHILARRASYSDHIKELVQVLLEAQVHEGLTPGEAIRKAAKATDQRNHRGQTPLMLACEHGNINCLRELLAAGADPWLGDAAVRRTCMHYAAGTGHAAAIEETVAHVHSHAQLRAYSKSVIYQFEVHDVPASSGMTPLHYAAWRRQVAAITALTNAGASLYSRSGPIGSDPECPTCNEGSTPLHLAALKGSQGAVKALLKGYVLLFDEAVPAGQPVQGQAQQQGQAGQAQQAGGQAHAGADVPLLEQQREARRQRELQAGALVDPRTVLDSMGYTPFAIARSKDHFHLLSDLNPLTPLAQVLAQDSPNDRAIGVPRLQELAAQAAHKILMQQITQLAHEIEVARQAQPPRVPPTSIYATVPTVPKSTAARLITPFAGGTADNPPLSQAVGQEGLMRAATASRCEGSVRGGARGGGSVHGSLLAETALLLANMPSIARASMNEGGQLSRNPSVRVGRVSLQHMTDSSFLEPSHAASNNSKHGPAPLMRASLSGVFSLRSSCAFAVQVEQEVARNKKLAGQQSSQHGQQDASHHLEQLEQLQQLQEWDHQDIEETLNIARTHRLLRGVEDSNEQESQLALVAVVSHSSGAGPSTAVMMDARGRPAETPAAAALSAAVNGTPAQPTAMSRASSMQRQRSRGFDGAEGGAQPGAAVTPPPRDGPMPQLAAVDEDSVSVHHGREGLATASRSPFGRTSSRMPQEPVTPVVAGTGKQVSLVSLSRQSSQVLGRVTLPSADTPCAATDLALARLASLSRQPSQPLSYRPSGSGGVATGVDEGLGGLTGLTSASRQASLAKEAPLLSAFDQACEQATVQLQHGGAGPAVGGGAPGMAEEEPDVCGVCLDSGDFVEMRKCGHSMCVDCATELVRLHEYKAALCPLCRGVITGFALTRPTVQL